MNKMTSLKILLSVAVLFLSQTVRVHAGADSGIGNPANGEKVFKTYCTACHNFIKGAKPDMYGVVLPLYGIIGKEAGKVPGFFYSKAMRKSGVVWTEEMLDKYIEDPKGTIPDIRMEFAGLKDAKDRKDMIAFFKAQMEKMK